MNPRLKKALFGLMGVVLLTPCLLCLFGIFWLGRDLGGSARDLPEEIKAAKREGLPLEPGDLQRRPPLQADRNAAPFYRDLDNRWQAVKSHRDIAKRAEDFATGKQSVVAPAVLEVIRENSDLLTDAVRAAKLPDCDFGRDYSLGRNLPLPEYETMKAMANLLCARARLSAQSGDMAGAFADLHAGTAIGRHVASDPILLAKLGQARVDQVTEKTARKILFSSRRGSRPTAEARGFLAGLPPLPDMRDGLRGECLLGWITVSNLPRFIKKARGSDAPEIPAGGVFQAAWQTRCLQFWRGVFKLWPEGAQVTPELAARYSALCDSQDENKGPSYFLSGLTSGVYSTAVRVPLTDETERRLTAAAVDILEYHDSHAAWPPTLSAVGHDYRDPVDGRPLRYRATASGFVVYGVGRDGHDDGGRDRFPPGQMGTVDIVVRYDEPATN